jgi:serine/threonine-protein kinase
VGALIYSLLSGRPPFEHESDMAVLAKVLTDEPPPLSSVAPEVPELLSRLTARLLLKDRFKRPSNAAELRQHLLSLTRVDSEPVWQAAQLAVNMQLSRGGTPRPGSASGHPGVLALSGTPPKSQTAPRPAVSVEVPIDVEGMTDLKPVARPRGGLMVLGLLGLGLVGGLAAFAIGSHQQPPQPQPVITERAPVVTPPPPEPGPEPTKEPTPVSLTLRATPPEARFVIDGEAREGNPCTVQHEPNSTHHVKVQAEHFVAVEVDLLFDHSQVQNFALAPEVSRPLPKDASRPPKDVKKKRGPMGLDENNPFQQ